MARGIYKPMAGGNEQALLAALLSDRQRSKDYRTAANPVGSAIGDALGKAGDMYATHAIGQAGEDARNQALADALVGVPASFQTPGLGAGGQIDPTVGLQSTPGQAGMAPGASREQVLAMSLAGFSPEQIMSQLVPEPISPYQERSLGLQEQGLGLQEQGLDLQGQRIAQAGEQFGQTHALNKAQLDAQVAFNNAKLRLDEAELGTKGQPKLSDIGAIRKEYTGASQDWTRVRDARGKMQAAFERPGPAGDVSMIFGFMKIVDPNTGVKEGEFATAQQTAGIPERIVGLYNRALQGERLTDAQRADFMNQANALTRAQLDQQLRTEQEFGDLAEAYSIPRHHVTPDLIGDLREGLPEIEVPVQAGSEPGGVMSGLQSMGRDALEAITGAGDPAQVRPEPPPGRAAAIATMGEEQLGALDRSAMSLEELQAASARWRQIRGQ